MQSTNETQLALEQATLNALVWANEGDRAEAIYTLPSGAFTRGAHRLIYDALSRCVETQQAVDYMTVLDELEAAGHTAEDVGGLDAFMDTLSGRSTYENVVRLAGRLAEGHARRSLTDELRRLQQRAEDRTVPLDAITSEGVDSLLSVGAPTDSIVKASSVMDDLMKLWDGGLPPGASTGWPSLDKLYRVPRGQWTLLTGIPGHGKSTFLDSLMVNLARDEGWKFCIFSPENSPSARHMAKLIAAYTLRPFEKEKLTRRDLGEAVEWVDAHFRWIDPNAITSLTAVLARVRSLNASWGVDGFVIDPWNELEHAGMDGLDETTYISRALTQLRQAARKTNAHAWMVAHPKKLQRNADGTYPVPTPYDVSGSANWRNKADFSVTVYRPDVTNPDIPSRVYVQKVRFQENGQPGVTDLIYEPRHNTFYEPLDHATAPHPAGSAF